MFYALLCLLVCLVALIFLPLVSDENNRRLWASRIFPCRWRSSSRNDETTNRAIMPQLNVSNATLAKEDAIRAAFVQEKLRRYTKTVTETDILTASRHRSYTLTTATSVGDSSEEDENDVEKANATSSTIVCGDEPKTEKASSNNVTTNRTEILAYVETETVIAPTRESPTTHDNADSFDISRHGTIFVPPAGHCNATMQSSSLDYCFRQESGTCAICLSAIGVRDTVTWSSNADCPHLFHTSCIQNWLVASGRKHWARTQQQQQQRHQVVVENASSTTDMESSMVVTDFPMLCPCCRRPFILIASLSQQAGARADSVAVSDDNDCDELEQPSNLNQEADVDMAV